MADLSITAANVVRVSGTPQVYYAGEVLTAGDVVYIKTSDGKAWQCDADDTSATATVKGVAINSASANQPVAVMQTAGDVVNIGGTLTVGETYVLSGTAGAICPVADLATSDYVTYVGYASTTANLTLLLKSTGVQHA